MSVVEEQIRKNWKIDAGNWKGYEDGIEEIFSLYREKINPMVAVYNSATGKFPIGVLNELRDTFAHLTKSLEDPDGTERQLELARGHCKRAAIDGFKYAAMAYSKRYDDFTENYGHVDLRYVNNGQFLPELTRLQFAAGDSLERARLAEAGPHTDDELYSLYEDAVNRHRELYEHIMDAIQAAEAIRLQTEEDQQEREKEHRTDRRINIVSVVFGIGGFAVGIIGILINFL